MEMKPAQSQDPSFSPARRWSILGVVLTSILLLMAILAMANYVTFRNPQRAAWGAADSAPLSSKTLLILESLTNDVDVVVYYDRREPLYTAVSDLIDEYAAASPRITPEYVDYARYPGRAQSVQAEYGLTPGAERDCIIFRANGRTRVVSAAELSEFDTSGILRGEEIKRTHFRGEQIFSSAIYSVIDSEKPAVYFLSGHGEHDPSGTDDLHGYVRFTQLIHENNARTGVVSLATNDVPSECDLLIVAGPRRRIPSEELLKIERFLKQGGRLLALFNIQAPPTGLEDLLLDWGLDVSSNWVTDAAESKSGDSTLLLSHFGGHPIVAPLLRSRLQVVLPRPITARGATSQAADAAKVSELVLTSPGAQALAAIPGAPDQARIVGEGQIPVMAASERGSIPGVDSSRGVSRVVACGDSFFLGNRLIETEANRDFAALTLNWLLNRDTLLQGIGPREIREYELNVTQSQMKRIQWILIGFLPGIVFLVGGVVWFRRAH